MKKIICLVLCILTVSSLFSCVKNEDPVNEDAAGRRICFESDNYKVDTAMLTYFFLSDFYSSYSRNESAYSLIGLDVTVPLGDQNYDDESTWFDYFIEVTSANIQSFLYYAEAGVDEGFTTEETDKLIEEEFEFMKERAQTLGMTLSEYIETLFGSFVEEQDIRNALGLQFYARAYYSKIVDGYDEEPTVEDYEAYYDKNKLSIDRVDYTSYPVGQEDSAIQTTGASYIENDELSKWAFDPSRESGDITVINGIEYVLNETAYRSGVETRDFRHILFTQETYGSLEKALGKVEEVALEYISGDMTEEFFVQLQEKYSEDEELLYENVIQGKLVDGFDDWLFDSQRIEGDVDVIQTEYGYHLVYFCGTGLAEWMIDARDGMLEDYISEYARSIEEKYTVSVNRDNVYAISDVVPENAFQSTEETAEE